MEINEIVRRLRENRNLTQENLAEEIKVHVSTINRYESKGSTIPMDKLEDIAKALKVSVSNIYEYKKNPTLLEEPLEYYRTTRKQIGIMVQLDGTEDTLNEWFTTLRKLNAAI